MAAWVHVPSMRIEFHRYTTTLRSTVHMQRVKVFRSNAAGASVRGMQAAWHMVSVQHACINAVDATCSSKGWQLQARASELKNAAQVASECSWPRT
eukprot:5413797-Pleurochrysis_carterae.AAC.1